MPAKRPSLAVTALILALASLTLNAFLIWRLSNPEPLVRPVVERLAGPLLSEEGVIQYDVIIPAGTPLNFDIPIDESFAVAVDTVIPLNTVIRVPFESPVGTYSVRLPIRADIPVRQRLPLRIRHTFQLRTQTREAITVPIRVDMRDLLR